MANTRGRKKCYQSASSPVRKQNKGSRENPLVAEKDDVAEVERPIAAIRALSDMETQHLSNGLLLLKSNFTQEQLQLPLLQFFNENLPNLMLTKNEKNGQYEVKYKDTDNELMNQTEDRNIHASLLRRLSSVYPCSSAAMPSFASFDVSGVGNSLLGSDNMLMEDFVPEKHNTHMLGLQEALQTPGATSHRLSVGMTPKSRRLPKLGEMLLSVHGSPLGVYNDDVMEAIQESEEG
ncbi:uncharacterized protein LOC124931717 [Impatiens glandulifera]|uniref:uncharacterized protein LOC124931717 n=1 Tax=Impatiens glandulifera TaxID=253017 RepID=UPI001FB0AC79|nr:uncharacterized protein LOC124931717 [Impatiens glandulifera]